MPEPDIALQAIAVDITGVYQGTGVSRKFMGADQHLRVNFDTQVPGPHGPV